MSHSPVVYLLILGPWGFFNEFIIRSEQEEIEIISRSLDELINQKLDALRKICSSTEKVCVCIRHKFLLPVNYDLVTRSP